MNIQILLYLLLVQFFWNVASFQLKDPQISGVTFVEKDSQIQVTVDEHNSGGRKKIILIAEVQGELQLITTNTIHPEVIGAEIEAQDSDYVITVNLPDYEKLVAEHIETTFVLGIQDGDDLKNFQLSIRNIDDESPIIATDRCQMMEETNNTECAVYVYDPDGKEWRSGIQVTIYGYLEDIFEIRYTGHSLTLNAVYLVLKEGQKLDYETINVYEITVVATDGAGHSSDPQSLTIMVLDKPPEWTYLPTDKHIDEATNTSFIIAAADTDTNSNHEVNYVILYDNTENIEGLITIDTETGNVIITSTNGQPDREYGAFTTIYLHVCAFYPEYPTISTCEYITLIIDDIDDNVAKFYDSQETVFLVPKSPQTVSFNASANDIDWDAENANFSIDLIVPDKVMSAFDVSPRNGMGFTSIEITVNTTQLDFDDPQWNSFKIELRTTGVKTKENVDSLSITVFLQSPSGGSDLRASEIIFLIFLIFSLITRLQLL